MDAGVAFPKTLAITNCPSVSHVLQSSQARESRIMPTISAHISPSDKAAGDYCYVPFDVPAGIVRIDVRYEYSHPRHHGDFEGVGNTIDLGLFDPRGHAFGNGAGFRGWSGSDRAQISLGESAADTTPGYLAGPIPAGRWHVILGL